MRVALVQMAVQDGEPLANLRRAEALIASAPGADLYLLPELWTTGYAHGSWRDAARGATPAVLARLRELAAETGAWIAGSLVTDDGGLRNRLWLVPPAGEPVHYDKSHLFRPMDEHLHLEAGAARAAWDLGGVRTAPSICFDLRFPEMYRRDAVEGAELFLVASAWPHPRGKALRLLARARALENQAFLALCNRTGPGADGTQFCGGSMLVSPQGEVLADAGEGEGVTVAELDPGRVRDLRTAFPVLEFRQKGLDF